jgi:arylsulfatase A-like enzyme
MAPNVLFILLDSCRADKFTGKNKSSFTPNLDKLIEDGAYFFQNISSADGTLLSWASLFTGLHPFKTGIRSEQFHKLDKNTPTFFDTLTQNGYHFYGHLPTISKTVGIFPTFENDNSTFDYYLNMSDGLGKKIIDMFDLNQMQTPWFTYLHIEDLHFPIDVPEGFDDDKFGKTNFDKSISNLDTWIGKIIEKIDMTNTLIIITADHGAYLTSISHNDTQVSLEANASLQTMARNLGKNIPNFLKPLKAKIFFTLEKIRKKRRIRKIKNLNLKPHQKRGLLWQRSDLDHFLYDDLVHVPLLFAGFGIPKGIKISQQVRTLDIFPTIVEILGLSNIENIDGHSLADLFHGKKITESIAYIESPHLSKEIVTNDVIGLRTSEFKYFRDKDDSQKRIHLYNLKNDPFEDENIASINPQTVKFMENELQKILSHKSSIPIDDDEETQKIEDELKKLGYI